jgi:hypothetical protein
MRSGLNEQPEVLAKSVFQAREFTLPGGPIVSDELKDRYQGRLVAFSTTDNRANWGDSGAALTRRELSEKMKPLICGKDYYVHAIE